MAEAQPAPGPGDLKTMALVAYGLLAATPLFAVTAIIAVVIAYVQRGSARGTAFESHFDNAIVVFWAGLIVFALLSAVALQAVLGTVFFIVRDPADEVPPHALWPLLVLPAVYLAGVAFLVWFYYRVIRGIVRASESRPYRDAARLSA